MGSSNTARNRADQMFPVLDPGDVARVRQFGEPRRYVAGEVLFHTGERDIGLILVLSGAVDIHQHDGTGHAVGVAHHGPGQFIGEVSGLSGKPALVDGVAAEDVEAVFLSPEQLRRLIVAEADLGERLMRALILRRASLIESCAAGPLLIAEPDDSGRARIGNFLRRNGFPFRALTPTEDPAVAEMVAAYRECPNSWPLLLLADGRLLRNPSDTDVAHALGMIGETASDRVYDVAVVGAGPAGLSAAVYAASEGLSVLVLDARGFGGQAGASARIENYFGFPTGITGQALTARGFVQAQKFGAEIAIPACVESLDCEAADGIHRLRTEDGRSWCARTVVIASGARYRRPPLDDLARFEGRGVWYWASPMEIQLCQGQEVALVGGGNSAGQAAVYLASHGCRVRMMVRGAGLAATMSRYLIDRIEANPAIELMTGTELVALEGDARGLQSVRWRRRADQSEARAPIRHVFLFIGAEPATGWLHSCRLDTDRNGFVLCGGDPAYPLATSRPGVFAIGDVRAGSVKRVGGAIGEGATVVAQIHAWLASRATEQAAATA
ncbi:FAD-dependent oxidoreductase [Dyella ginsengisoli]|uniref:FAD-dependent oxidoreductase n=1 Tax=Dyella ginsengisoli TaxID=363848 RepID=UPI00037B9551|nr:FAD-dependent oxidoreductase [Dyella ginsengisoli]